MPVKRQSRSRSLTARTENIGIEEERFCYCGRGNFGTMVACDNSNCPFQWFHEECLVGRNRPFGDENEKWYCDECLEQLKSREKDKNYGEDGKVTYNGMIGVALRALPSQEGTFEEICNIIETRWSDQLNWKVENDVRRTPVWRSSVRKIILSNSLFRKSGPSGKIFTFARKLRR